MRALLAASIFPAVLAAGDGLAIVQTRADLGRGVEYEQTIWVEPDRAVVQTRHEGRPVRYVYRSEDETLLLIEEDRKVYRALSGDELKQLEKRNREWAAEIEKQMREKEKNLPPEQRAIVEAMRRGEAGGMGARGRETERAPVVYERERSAGEVDGRACERRSGIAGGEKVAEVCTVPWEQYGVEDRELAVAAELARLLAERPPGTVATIALGGADWKKRGQFPGAPLEWVEYEGGAVTMRTTLVRVERGAADDAVFDVPEGYQERYGFGF